ncbi:MAG: class I SAM-dependent methyltransferase [Acidobacteriota bacterium]
MDTSTTLVKSYYDTAAQSCEEQYERAAITDVSMEYPANYFRLQLLLNSFAAKGVKRVIEVGVGEGTPLATLTRAGLDAWGFDISEEMVARSRRRMQEIGKNPDQVGWGDVQDPISYAHLLREGLFDGLLAMGVMPHVHNERAVLENMKSMVRPGGSVFVEFRNSLFSLFTFNRYTLDFILNDLLRDVSPTVKAAVEADLKPRLRVDMPKMRTSGADGEGLGYDAILSKFHNPLEVVDLFNSAGFKDVKLLWYHYHPAMPYLEGSMAEAFRSDAARLEHETSGWRGLFLCSAFVVEAIKG